MPTLRTNKCDVCGFSQTELDYGTGWKGWSIISGIAAKEPVVGEALTHENMNMALCPKHTLQLTDLLTVMQKENE